MLDLLKRRNMIVTECARQDIHWLLTFLPLYNGISLIRELTVIRTIFIDLCLSEGRELHGATDYSVTYPSSLQACFFSISSLQGFNILMVLRMWTPSMQSQQVTLFCDNTAAVTCVQSETAVDLLIRGIAHEALLLSALHDIDLEVRHRPSVTMQESDLLSRTVFST